MAAVKKNILIEERATFRWRLTWQSKTGKPVNLTGWTAAMELRAAKDELSPVLFTLSTANGRITMTSKGVIDLFISDEDTDTLEFEKAYYDLVLTAPNGDRVRLLEGEVKTSPGVTL